MLTLKPAPGRTGQLYYMQGDKKVALARNIDLGDAAAVTKLVEDARTNYPTQALKISVFHRVGNSPRLLETLEVHTPDLDNDDMTDFATPTTAGRRPGLSGLGEVGNYILSQSNDRLLEKDDRINELRDQLRLSQESERRLTEKNRDLEFDLKFKDTEHALAIQRMELEAQQDAASQPQGLAGIAQSLPPEVLTPLLNGLIARFIPGGAPAPAAPAQLGSHLTSGQREVIQALTEWASASEEQAVQMYRVIQIALSQPDGKGMAQLVELVHQNFQTLNVA